MDKIIIEIGSNTTGLDAAAAAIEKLRMKEKALADEVQKTAAKEKEIAQKQLGIIDNLIKRQQQLTAARNASNDPVKIQRYNKLLEDSGKRMDQLTNKTKQVQKSTSDLSGVMGKVSAAIASAFAISQLTGFVKSMVETRAEFQKFEAQLTTALGSKSLAQSTMGMLQDFAAKTPFSVKEITDAYVKLANRGLRPTSQELTKLGDVAAALGKPLEQVNEAILDINNTERWKELGIKVQTSGNKIIGTFRGVTVEALKTERGAMKMMETFGQLDGVAGGMARQMDTLGGQMSNLGDNWDSLMNNMGKSSEGFFSTFFSGMNQALSDINEVLANDNKIVEALKGSGFEKDFWEKYVLPASVQDNIVKFQFKITEEQKAFNKVYEEGIELAEKEILQKKENKNLSAEQIENMAKELSVKRAQAYTQAGFNFQLSEAKKQLESGNISQEDYIRMQLMSVKASKDLKESTEGMIKGMKENKNVIQETIAEQHKREAQLKKEIELLDSLKNKLKDLRIEEKELLAQELPEEEKTKELYKIKQQKVQEDFDKQKEKIDKEIKNKKRHDEAIVNLEVIKDQMLINLAIKYDQDYTALKKKQELSEIEYAKRMSDMRIHVAETEGEDEGIIYVRKSKNIENYYDKLISLETDESKRAELELKKKSELADLEKELNDKITKNREEAAKKQKKADEDALKAREELTKKVISNINEVLQVSLQAEETQIDNEMKSQDIRIANEDKVIETQRVLAAKGYANTLAQEEKHRDDMVKQQLAAQKKLKRVKELEIFLNALAKFTEENPKTAVIKALGVITAAEVASVGFAEEGGIVGNGMATWTGQRHKSGRDRKAIVEDGEVIIPKLKAQEMGITTPGRFQSFIRTPFKNKIVTSGNIMQVNNNSELVKEIRGLQEIVRNKKELSVSWEGLDMRLSELENGIKKTTVVKRNLF